MATVLHDIIKKHSTFLAPIPTETPAELNELGDIRAVLFDIYGTLFVSGAGDISLQTGTSSDDLFREALQQCGVPSPAAEQFSATDLKDQIAVHHAIGRERGVAYPEVDIVQVWSDLLQKISSSANVDTSHVDPEKLAVEYEVRINPIWPMPGLEKCIDELHAHGLFLGIVSNAQAMTLELFPALVGRNLEQLGFCDDLQFFSFRFGESKPGLSMFQAATAALANRGILPSQTVFVGNDALNDVWAASRVGLRTMLFAGDARSLRLRAGDKRMDDCSPDAVITDLTSVGDCLGR